MSQSVNQSMFGQTNSSMASQTNAMSCYKRIYLPCLPPSTIRPANQRTTDSLYSLFPLKSPSSLMRFASADTPGSSGRGEGNRTAQIGCPAPPGFNPMHLLCKTAHTKLQRLNYMIHRRYVDSPLWALSLVSVLLCCASCSFVSHVVANLHTTRKTVNPHSEFLHCFHFFRFALDHRWLSLSPSLSLAAFVHSSRPSLPFALGTLALSLSLSHGTCVQRTDTERQTDRQVAQKDLPVLAWMACRSSRRHIRVWSDDADR